MYAIDDGLERLTGEDDLMHALDETEEGFLELDEFGEDDLDMLAASPARQPTARPLAL